MKYEESLLSSFNNAGPEAKEYNLLRADEEYHNGNQDYSIYYQVRAQFQSTDLRYLNDEENQPPQLKDLLKVATDQEQSSYKSNTFLKNVINYIKEKEPSPKPKPSPKPLDFLETVQDPSEGLKRIRDICHQLPPEWCVLQISKSFNPATTYSVFQEIMASNGTIYLTLLNHCRSTELGPTCLNFSQPGLEQVFKQYSTLVERFKKVVTVDPANVKSKEAKEKYWLELNEYSKFLKKLLDDLRGIFSPYSYLFLGKRYDCPSVKQLSQNVFHRVDGFCLKHQWSQHQRILLSQAALHANRLDSIELKLLCYELSPHETETQLAYDFLKGCASEWQQLEEQQPIVGKRFPTILLVDERLDHFHWEQLVPTQEFSRVKSLHSLWRLYQCHQAQIQHGFYIVNIKKGMCMINPDADLANSGRRLRGFFEYWLSHWRHLFETVPTEQLMLTEAYQADCFVYAGHGSGLQYINGRVICRNRVRGVVFLFGCDSTRMLGAGLYSALYGAHDYYHGAQCPTVVGTLMPALDSNMDTVSVTVLSHFLSPGDKQVIPWATHVDRLTWIKKGVVKAHDDGNQRLEDHKDYHIGSLCAILSRVQQGLVEPAIYNCCIYVCRGLPAWNVAVEKLPF